MFSKRNVLCHRYFPMLLLGCPNACSKTSCWLFESCQPGLCQWMAELSSHTAILYPLTVEVEAQLDFLSTLFSRQSLQLPEVKSCCVRGTSSVNNLLKDRQWWQKMFCCHSQIITWALWVNNEKGPAWFPISLKWFDWNVMDSFVFDPVLWM